MAANLELGYKCLLNCFLVGLGKRAKLADPRMRIQRQNPQTLKTQKFGIGGSFGMQRERERNRERERDQLAFATWLALFSWDLACLERLESVVCFLVFILFYFFLG